MVAGRLLATPLARRLARKRGITLASVRGSGPRGRIVAADLVPAPSAVAPDTRADQVAALSCMLDLAELNATLEHFAKANLAVELEDALVRAVGCGLLVASEHAEDDAGVAIETPQHLVVCRNPGASSLSALHNQRVEGSDPATSERAVLSIKLISGRGLIPTLMPILPGFDMRLVIVGDGDAANATIFFNARVEAGVAASILSRIKQLVEHPILMLA